MAKHRTYNMDFSCQVVLEFLGGAVRFSKRHDGRAT